MMKRPLAETDAPSPASKRQRTSCHTVLKAKYRQPGDLLPSANPQNPAVVEGLIDRSLAIALHGAGFQAVKKDAFDSLHNATTSYLRRLTNLTHIAMNSSRRTKPIPQDFLFALRDSHTSLNSLLPHLKPAAQKRPPSLKTVRRTTQPPLFPRAPTTSTTCDFDFKAAAKLSTTLGGDTDKASHPYIPRHFPPFPPPHTYKATPVPLAERESDARKIRERATQEGVLAERALRKLVQARKGGERPRSRHGHTGKQEDVFQEAMDAVLKEDEEKGRESLQREDEMLFLGEGEQEARGKEEEERREKRQTETVDLGFGALVNHERAHWRSGARDMFGVM